ncbi:MAG: hypothetical protein R3236_10285 [Phycisphaeraceae bacterium]|nr:hypothetical protein [Phycisphaeraceae bacterium]
MNDRYDDKILLDYIEGELEPSQRAQVEQWMKQDPPLALMVRQMISDRNELRGLYDPPPPDWVMEEVDQQVDRAILFGNYDGGSSRFKRNQRGAMGIILMAGGRAALLGVVALFVVLPAIDDPPPPDPTVQNGRGKGSDPTPPVVKWVDPDDRRRAMAAETSPPDFWQWPRFLQKDWAAAHGRLSPWHMTPDARQQVVGVASAIQQQPQLAESQQLRIVSTDPLATFARLQAASVDGQVPTETLSPAPIYYLYRIPQNRFRQLIESLAGDSHHVRLAFVPRTAGIVKPPPPKPKVNPFEHWPRLSPDYAGFLEQLIPKEPEPEIPEEVKTAVPLLVVFEPAPRHDRARRMLETLRASLSESH